MTHGIYTDFFNKSLPMPTEGPSDADEAAALLGGLTSAEIRRVIFAPRYCPRLEFGIIPIFAEFNRYLLFYPEDIIRKLLNVPGAAFQFNVRSLDYKDTVKFVMSLISSGKHVLFGTGARRAGRYEADTGDHFRLLRRSLGEADFNLLMLGALKFCRPPVYSR